MYDTILVEKKDHIATLTLNRAEKLNAVNPQLKREVYQALNELEVDDDVRVVVMTGAGRAFSVGGDMDAILSGADMEYFFSFEEEEKLLNFDKPIIAAVNGYALGDGCQHALLCDIIIASEKAIFGPIGARIGALCHVAVWALPGVVGRNRASELLFTCDQISAEEAYRIGLVNKIVPHNQLMPAALEMAKKIMKSAPLSLKYTKRALRRGLFDADLKSFLQEELSVLLSSEDMKEAAKAFLEKREPVFKGK
jgi:enoyl-CoA hydratase/carnithine racemase